MLLFNDLNIYLLLLYLTLYNSVVVSQLKEDHHKNVTLNNTQQTNHTTTSITDGNSSSIVNSSITSGVKIISAASFTYTDTSSFKDYSPKKTPPKPKKPKQPKKTSHYDSHKASYEEYFKSYNRHPHDHDYDQHRHHHHPPSRDHPPPPPPPPPPREHPHDNDHHSNGVNDKTTLPSDWIYDHLEEYLSCIYEQQINCEDQFVTQLQLKLLKMKSTPYSSEQHHLQKPITFETEGQNPTLTFTFNSELKTKKTDKTEEKPHTNHKHDKIDKERRPATSEHPSSIDKIFEISQHNEEEKFFTHEFHKTSVDYSSSNKDEYYHRDHHHEHHHHQHVNGNDEHNDLHHPHHRHEHYYHYHHHDHKEHKHPSLPSSHHDKYDWSSKMDAVMPLLKYDSDKVKDKHSHTSPTHRHHDKNKY